MRTLGKKELQPRAVTAEEHNATFSELQEREIENFLDVGDIAGNFCEFEGNGEYDCPVDNREEDESRFGNGG